VAWFNMQGAMAFINQFLSRWQSQIRNLNQTVAPSSMFECFCFISLIDAYDQSGYQITRKGPQDIYFKRSVPGWANNFTYFVASGSSGVFEIRQNQGYRNHQVYFNLDIVIINSENSLAKNTLEFSNLHTFCECKHYRSFSPSLCAYFLGLARIVMPTNILMRTLQHPYPPPILLVSGTASREVTNMRDLVQQKRYHVRFLDSISPITAQSVLFDWINMRL